jgi:selenocysteine lyase/cysteine desulfurase
MLVHTRFSLPASTRASLSLYTDEEDIEKLITGIETVKKVFER